MANEENLIPYQKGTKLAILKEDQKEARTEAP